MIGEREEKKRERVEQMYLKIVGLELVESYPLLLL